MCAIICSASRMTRQRHFLLQNEPLRVRQRTLLHGVPSAHTCPELGSQENTLLDVVQSLGEYINDEDSRIRGRAVSYLTAVLSALPPKFLSRQQIDVLCQFFSDRIEDGGAIEGLIKLQSLDRFTNEMAQTVVRA
jgi:DNA repair/transcription protein MET18/MMS19